MAGTCSTPDRGRAFESGDFSVVVESGQDGGLLTISTGTTRAIRARYPWNCCAPPRRWKPRILTAVFPAMILLSPKVKVHGDVESREPSPGIPCRAIRSSPIPGITVPIISDDIAVTTAVLNVDNHQFNYVTGDCYLSGLRPHGTRINAAGMGGIIRIGG